MCKKVLTRYSINVILISTSNITPSYLKFSYNFILVVRLLKRSESEFIMTTKKSVKVDGEFLTSLFENKANEILAKESKKKATKKVSTEKSEVKAEKPKTKKTVKATKKADTETVKKDEKITKKPATKKVTKKAEKPATKKVTKKAEKPATKKVTKKAEKPAKEQAEKPKKATKKAKAEVEQEQEKALRRIEKPLKIAKSTYKVVTDINNYDELLKAVESEREIAVAFDCSEVSKSDYENIFHVPYVNMKDNFDVCEPIFIGEKVPRLVFASIYSEALWDLFPEEFDLVSAILEK